MTMMTTLFIVNGSCTFHSHMLRNIRKNSMNLNREDAAAPHIILYCKEELCSLLWRSRIVLLFSEVAAILLHNSMWNNYVHLLYCIHQAQHFIVLCTRHLFIVASVLHWKKSLCSILQKLKLSMLIRIVTSSKEGDISSHSFVTEINCNPCDWSDCNLCSAGS